MAQNFSGAVTSWKSASAISQAYSPTANSIDNKAMSEASSIAGNVATLRAQAEGYAESAYSFIEKCMGFSASVARVSYRPPVKVVAALNGGDTSGSPPGVESVSPGEMAGFNGDLDIQSPPETGSAPAPEIAMPNIPPPPSSSITVAAPSPPSTRAPAIPPVPEVSFSFSDAPDPSPIGDAPGITVDLSLASTESFSIPVIDDGEIQDAIDRLRTIIGRSVSIPRYALLFPEVFEVAGSLMTGDFVVDAETMLAQSDARVSESHHNHDGQMARLWSMPAASDDSLGEYLAVMRAKADRSASVNNAVAEADWTLSAIGAAYSVGVAAHSMMMDLELSVYDAEFDATMTQAEGALELARASVAAYNVAASRYNAQLDAMGVVYERLKSKARRYEASVDLVQAQGQINGAIADGFAAAERAKSGKADGFAARVSISQAIVGAYEARMRAAAASARALAAEGEKYKADVLNWEASAESMRGQYARASALARATAAMNQAEASKARLAGAQNDRVAVDAQRAAAQAGASAAKLRANIAKNGSSYINTEAINAIESVVVKGVEARYDGEIAQWQATTDNKIGLMDGIAAEQSAEARFQAATIDAVGRAANLTQSARIQLANAYATAHEAAGRAGAAIESGRLSGYRASATLSAAGRLSSDLSFGATNSDSYGDSVSESNTETLQGSDE